MKIKNIGLVIMASLLAACSNTNNNEGEKGLVDKADVKVICPTGAPAVAFYNHGSDENFETNSVPSNIVSFLTASSPYDIVVIDTVSGLKAIKNGAPYKMYGTITFGNFFIASTGNDEDGVMGIDDKIVLFGQNQTPDLLFHYIYGNAYNDAIEYVAAVSDAAACLASGKNVATGNDVDYVLVAQPVLFATLHNESAATFGKASSYANLQEEYKTKSENKKIIQASIFVKNSTQYKYDSYLSSLENDIKALVETPNLAVEKLGSLNQTEVKTKYGILPNVMKNVLSDNNGLGLGFKKASSIKEDIICKNCSVIDYYYATEDAPDEVKDIRDCRCKNCQAEIKKAEDDLRAAIDSNHLETLQKQFAESQKYKIDLKLKKEALLQEDKLKREKDVKELLDSLKVVENHKTIIKSVFTLGEKLKSAEENNVKLDEELLKRANHEKERLLAEKELRQLEQQRNKEASALFHFGTQEHPLLSCHIFPLMYL